MQNGALMRRRACFATSIPGPGPPQHDGPRLSPATKLCSSVPPILGVVHPGVCLGHKIVWPWQLGRHSRVVGAVGHRRRHVGCVMGKHSQDQASCNGRQRVGRLSHQLNSMLTLCSR